ncbi:MAG: histidine phosphatase family protein [Lachnospiraceae bacterium]|nr:histidine phosphatase family protein [Lachnospiraceae bacterium]
MELCLIRHGRTGWNEKGWFQGQTDVPLSDTGREQVRAAAERFRAEGITFDRVVSSPLVRAVETASIVTGLPMEEIPTDPRIREIEFGIFEGTDFFKPDYPGWEQDELPFRGLFEAPEKYSPPPGGEDFTHVLARTRSFLADMQQLAASSDAPGRILAACHGGIIRALHVAAGLAELHGIWDIKVENGRLFVFVMDGEHIRSNEGGV